jgi:hypothetical protein
VFVSHTEEELRQLASWLPGLNELAAIDSRIKTLWAELKDLRRQAKQKRSELDASCPLDLSALEFRFWTKVAIIDDEDSCWEYTGARHPLPDNYGSFRWLHPVTGENVTSPSSIVAMFLTDGCTPVNQANHHCDNPPCSRPKHLYDGTHLENMNDRHSRGRYGGRTRREQHGVLNSQAKLTDSQVIMARDWARLGVMLETIHAELGRPCNQTVLRWAITGRTWKHLDATCPPVVKAQNGSAIKGKKIPHQPPASRRLSDDDIRAIRRARAKDNPAREGVAVLAGRYGITAGMVSAIDHRRVYAHVTDQEES